MSNQSPQVDLHDDVVDDVDAHVGDEDEEEVARDPAPAPLHREEHRHRAVHPDHRQRQDELGEQATYRVFHP